MNIRRLSLVLAAAMALAACGKEQPAIDEALRQDLTLASQAYMPQPFMSPLEAGYGYAPNGYYQPGYPQAPYGYQRAVARSAPRIVRGTARSSAGVASGGGERVIKHTKRDAAIGAVAGAAIGAVTSGRKDRLKGAVLGAAVGAVLGGVVGNNVDLKRVPQ
ncbi:MAG: YMGG-like glycine zipper-containing protein [Gemmatimonadaceae bacterium]